MELDWGNMTYEWSFSRWLSNLNFTGTAVDHIGSGFVLRGEGNSNRSNNVSDNPSEDIEIPSEVIAALKGITGKHKGASKNIVKTFQNGMKDTKKVKRLVTGIPQSINETRKENGSISTQNYTIQDTASYILQYWKNGIPYGGSGAGIGAGRKGATEAARNEMKGSDLDSIQIIKMNN